VLFVDYSWNGFVLISM